MRPVPGRHVRRLAQRLVPGPARQIEGIAAQHTVGVQQQGHLRRPTGGRGRPATSCASACSTSSPASSSIDPLDVRRRNYVDPRRAAARHAHRPAVRRRHDPASPVEQAARAVDWEGFRAPPGRGPRRGPVPRHRDGVVPRGRARARRPRAVDPGGGIMGNEVTHVSVERRRHRSSIVTRQQPHGQGHETTLAQVAADELGVRFEDVGCVFGDTDVTPSRSSGPAAAGPRRWPTARCCTRSRELREKILSLAAELLEANAADLEISGGVDQRQGHARRPALARRARAHRGARSRSGCRDGADTDSRSPTSYDGGESGWSGGTHCCEVEVDVETGLVRDRPLRGGRGLRLPGQPGDRRGPDPRRRRPGHRRGAARARRLRRGRAVPRRRRSWTT